MLLLLHNISLSKQMKQIREKINSNSKGLIKRYHHNHLTYNHSQSKDTITLTGYLLFENLFFRYSFPYSIYCTIKKIPLSCIETHWMVKKMVMWEKPGSSNWRIILQQKQYPKVYIHGGFIHKITKTNKVSKVQFSSLFLIFSCRNWNCF